MELKLGADFNEIGRHQGYGDFVFKTTKPITYSVTQIQ